VLSKLLGLFRKRPVLIQGSSKLREGQSKLVSIGDPLAGGVEIVLARTGGKLYALDRRCPHENGHLTDGPLMEGKYALCPLHNYKFDPASGRAIDVACGNAKTYVVRERGDDCEVFV
jgi:nitrite reductase/ring-hydroxylating ferredoxin subunit